LEDFYRQVDDLRLAVDRAAARVEILIKGKPNL
jgi:ubiquinone biosynthesis protein UbiJ